MALLERYVRGRGALLDEALGLPELWCGLWSGFEMLFSEIQIDKSLESRDLLCGPCNLRLKQAQCATRADWHGSTVLQRHVFSCPAC